MRWLAVLVCVLVAGCVQPQVSDGAPAPLDSTPGESRDTEAPDLGSPEEERPTPNNTSSAPAPEAPPPFQVSADGVATLSQTIHVVYVGSKEFPAMPNFTYRPDLEWRGETNWLVHLEPVTHWVEMPPTAPWMTNGVLDGQQVERWLVSQLPADLWLPMGHGLPVAAVFDFGDTHRTSYADSHAQSFRIFGGREAPIVILDTGAEGGAGNAQPLPEYWDGRMVSDDFAAMHQFVRDMVDAVWRGAATIPLEPCIESMVHMLVRETQRDAHEFTEAWLNLDQEFAFTSLTGLPTRASAVAHAAPIEEPELDALFREESLRKRGGLPSVVPGANPMGHIASNWSEYSNGSGNCSELVMAVNLGDWLDIGGGYGGLHTSGHRIGIGQVVPFLSTTPIPNASTQHVMVGLTYHELGHALGISHWHLDRFDDRDRGRTFDGIYSEVSYGRTVRMGDVPFGHIEPISWQFGRFMTRTFDQDLHALNGLDNAHELRELLDAGRWMAADGVLAEAGWMPPFYHS